MRIDRTLNRCARSRRCFTRRCVPSAAPVARGEYLCQDCVDKAPRIVAPFCAKCSEPFSGAINETFTCANCEHRTFAFRCGRSRLSQPRGGSANRCDSNTTPTHLRHPLADGSAKTMNDSRLRPRHFRPDRSGSAASRAGTRARFQSGRAPGGAPGARDRCAASDGALERIRYTTTQTAFDRAERMENLHDAFRLRKKSERARVATCF